MTEDSVVALHHPGVTADPLTAVLRARPRELLAQAIEAEVAAVLAAHEHLKRRRPPAPGASWPPERAILTGIGPVSVRRPKVRDRGSAEESASVCRPFCPVSRAMPTLYLRGVSSGDLRRWRRCSASAHRPPEGGVGGRATRSARRYVYMWADGIYLQGRLEDEKQCSPHRRQPEGRNSWASRRGCARAPRAGVSCWHACSRLVPSSPSAMALWASGRRWRRSFPTPAGAAGSTRQPMS